MGRPKKNDAFTAFGEWVEQEHLMTRSSACNYASKVRRMFQQLRALDSQSLDDFLAGEVYGSTFRSAWKRFAEYCALQGQIIPMPTPASKPKSEYAIPEPICDDYLEILSSGGLTVKLLGRIRWEHVLKEVRRGAWEIEDEMEPGTYFRVPIRPMERIELWAKPPDAKAPLLPAYPGAAGPMPLTVSRRILASRRRTRSLH